MFASRDQERNHVEPDVFAVRLRDGVVPPFPFEMSDVLLAVEVVSASTGSYDYQTKRRLYLGNDVPEYWIVDPAARTFTRFRSLDDPAELLTMRLKWQPAGFAEAFIIELPECFEDASG